MSQQDEIYFMNGEAFGWRTNAEGERISFSIVPGPNTAIVAPDDPSIRRCGECGVQASFPKHAEWHESRRRNN